MSAVCAECGSANATPSRYCSECGHKIRVRRLSRGTPGTNRKTARSLFGPDETVTEDCSLSSACVISLPTMRKEVERERERERERAACCHCLSVAGDRVTIYSGACLFMFFSADAVLKNWIVCIVKPVLPCSGFVCTWSGS